MFRELFTNQDDRNEITQLRKRQQYEEERKERIFNAKQRLYGVDVPGLELQIKDKNKIKTLKREQDERFIAQEQARNDLISTYAREEEILRKKQILELDTFRKTYQRPEQRREFDINDPMMLKNAKNIRDGDNDRNLGLGSAQVFEGEDINFADRRRAQGEQQRSWLNQQIDERIAAEKDREIAHKALEEATLSCDKVLGNYYVEDLKLRQEEFFKVLNYNKEMAEKRKFKDEQRKKENREDDLAEIYNILTSDMFSGNSKGRNNFSDIEMTRFYEERRKQREEYNKKKSDAGLLNKQWEEFTIHWNNIGILKQLEQDRKAKHLFMETTRYNLNMAKEKLEQKEHERQTFRNVITPDFFAQFNKNSR
ncbi:RIB43A-like with coiled-coils protein 2 [Teleopsis dalmanni]|uniref:RIB43A-like with coiled-coils protein 2 n=1 Tax=Teleopsis dalmanni TaxID=139649 RepID=UPI000D32ABDC|nr:RIB43A-like with coiled-coils protein 2 [Teleopsis dalmanni]